jgi:hypothetical protein
MVQFNTASKVATTYICMEPRAGLPDARGEHSLLFRRMKGQTENFTPRRQSSPLGDNFAPRGVVKNGPLAPGHTELVVLIVLTKSAMTASMIIRR